jgi:hypothetical protein
MSSKLTEYECSKCGMKFDSIKSDIEKPVCHGCHFSKLKSSEKKISKNVPDPLRGFDESIRSVSQKIATIEDEEIKSYLREYVIIKLVNNIEVSFREIFVYWAGEHLEKLPKLFPNEKPKRLEMMFKEWDKKEQENVVYDPDPNMIKVLSSPNDRHKEKMIATALNFQNLDSINRIFSILFDFEFFSGIKEWGRIGDKTELEDNWNEIEKITRARNNLSHTEQEIEINDYELQKYVHLTKLFLTISSEIIWMYEDLINKPDASEEFFDYFAEHFNENYGISYEQAKCIFESSITKE